jgi:superfamily II DNA helicase RecQ
MSKKTSDSLAGLEPGEAKKLPRTEIAAILRGADEPASGGGRPQLVRILKGEADKKILELGLNQSPVFGRYRDLSSEEILARIDWVIHNGFLRLEPGGRQPALAYTSYGWQIEKETYAAELLAEFDDLLAKGDLHTDLSYLLERNREVLELLLEKIARLHDPKYIPLLENWEALEYKKGRGQVRRTIEALQM